MPHNERIHSIAQTFTKGIVLSCLYHNKTKPLSTDRGVLLNSDNATHSSYRWGRFSEARLVGHKALSSSSTCGSAGRRESLRRQESPSTSILTGFFFHRIWWLHGKEVFQWCHKISQKWSFFIFHLQANSVARRVTLNTRKSNALFVRLIVQDLSMWRR